MTRIAAHPVYAGLIGAGVLWVLLVGCIFGAEWQGIRRQIEAKRGAVHDVSHGSAVRFRAD